MLKPHGRLQNIVLKPHGRLSSFLCSNPMVGYKYSCLNPTMGLVLFTYVMFITLTFNLAIAFNVSALIVLMCELLLVINWVSSTSPPQ
jgi:hypothetical protein